MTGENNVTNSEAHSSNIWFARSLWLPLDIKIRRWYTIVMQGWMIGLIVAASVILLLAALTVIGSLIAVNVVLGRKRKKMRGEFPEKYAVDLSWFNEMADRTETLEITAFDGITLRGLLIAHGDKPRKVGILQHGYLASPRAMQPYAKILFDKGYDVLLPAARAHDISDGKYIGMAWLDRFDVLRWTDKIVKLYGDDVKIALMGVSMGGATVIAAAGMELPQQVKCVIDDCGFSSQRDEYYACVKQHVPLPKKLAILPLAIGVRFKCGYSVNDADIVSLAEKMRVPALFIHGSKDLFVPPELGRKLYEACGSADKSMLVVDGAEHAAAYATDKEKYTAVFTEFVDKYIDQCGMRN